MASGRDLTKYIKIELDFGWTMKAILVVIQVFGKLNVYLHKDKIVVMNVGKMATHEHCNVCNINCDVDIYNKSICRLLFLRGFASSHR